MPLGKHLVNAAAVSDLVLYLPLFLVPIVVLCLEALHDRAVAYVNFLVEIFSVKKFPVQVLFRFAASSRYSSSASLSAKTAAISAAALSAPA